MYVYSLELTYLDPRRHVCLSLMFGISKGGRYGLMVCAGTVSSSKNNGIFTIVVGGFSPTHLKHVSKIGSLPKDRGEHRK